MVGVGVAEGGGGGGGPGEPYYGEYYPPEQYFVPPEMCPHPQQHPQHAHMCTVHAEYGGMPVVTSATMVPQMLPPVLDEGMRHYLVPHPQHPQHPHPHHQHHQPHQPHHQPPPHHQPQHHYGPANGAGAPQHFYGAQYGPPHFHHVPPHHMQHSPPPPVYQKDERTQRQYSKLKQKLERKQTNRNNGIEVNSGASTPSLSPRKELNGRGGGSGGASSGAWSEGEGSSAGASVQGDDDSDTQAALDLLSATRIPQVSDMTPTSALVQWNTPLPEGLTMPAAELTYDLLLGDRARQGYKAIYSGSSLSCRVRDLRPGLEYSVCLQIRCGDASSGPGEAVTFRAPAAPPERAAPPRVTQRARSSLLLRWPAAADNGARISHYLLEMDAGDGFQELVRPRTRQHTVNNLRAQTRYRFRIAAVNEVGRGDWSDETVAWTCGAPPAVPAPPALAHAAPDRLALAWERRAHEEFTLQMDDAARGHGFLPVYSGAERTYVCTGLRRATDYRFRLRCETAEGQSPWCAEVTFRTLPERPAAPGRPAPKGKIHSRAFRLRWEPPADDGGAPLNSYTLELDGGEGFRCAYQGAEREAHCDRLQPGTPYRARVRCANAAGDSDWSPTETVATEATAPAACGAPELCGEPRATLGGVRWRAPSCLGGAPLTEYRVEVDGPPGGVRVAHAGLEPECVVRELAPGCEYRVWVVACNRVGAGPPSPALQFRTAPAPPDAPPAPAALLVDGRSARLEWSAPADNGAPILDYRLEMSVNSVNDAFAEVYRGAETSCVVGKLTPFSPYFFRVCARNAAGCGAWSAARDVLTPAAPPAAPAALRHEATADSLRLSWRAPADHGAEVLRYRVQVGEHSFDTETPAPERLVEGLLPDTVYAVRVAAFNELGLGEWSEETRAHTRPPPPAPPALRAAPPAHNHIKLEWEPLPECTTYCVEMRAADGREFRPVYRGCARSCKVKKLREATVYQFRIRASDERGGRGAWGDVVSIRTAAAPPPAPRALDVALPAPATPSTPATAARAARLSWDPLDDSVYVLQCAKSKDGVYKQVYEGSEPWFEVEELEPGAEFLFRVCCVRGGLSGAWSPVARLTTPPQPPPPKHKRVKHHRPLTPKQTALLMAGGFLVVAVVVAVLLQRLVEPRP